MRRVVMAPREIVGVFVGKFELALPRLTILAWLKFSVVLPGARRETDAREISSRPIENTPVRFSFYHPPGNSIASLFSLPLDYTIAKAPKPNTTFVVPLPARPK